MEDYEQSGLPKEATTDKNVELVHSLVMAQSGHVQQEKKPV